MPFVAPTSTTSMAHIGSPLCVILILMFGGLLIGLTGVYYLLREQNDDEIGLSLGFIGAILFCISLAYLLAYVVIKIIL